MGKQSPTIRRLVFQYQHSTPYCHAPSPLLSWSFDELEHDSYGWSQDSYDLEIQRAQTTRKFSVSSESSSLVPWPEEPLLSREVVTVRVKAHGRTHGEIKQSSDWSDWITIEGSLFSPNDWGANFVSAAKMLPRTVDDGSLRPAQFVKRFTIPSGRIAKARLYITSHGVYSAYLNEKVVGNEEMAPGWTSYKHRLYYQIYDVAALLQSGQENLIKVETAAGWYAGTLGWLGGRRFLFGDNLAIKAQLEITFEDKQSEDVVIASDETWEVRPSAVVQSEIYAGEIYDARTEQGDFEENSSNTSNWSVACIETNTPAELLYAQGPPVRITEEIHNPKIFKSPKGKWILDFGQNLVGKLRINSIHKPKDHKITFRHAEVLEHGELGTRPLRHAQCSDSLISAGKPIENWTPLFTFHGFRYVEVDGWTQDDDNCPLAPASITALVMHTDMLRTGWFECDHAQICQLHQNALWSMRGNFFSIPTDCPQRDERLGWTGDIQVFSPSANFLYDTSGMLSGWLQDVAAEQLLERDGAVPPFVVPNVIHRENDNIPDHWFLHVANAVWDDVTVITPWDLYQAFGDSSILERQYASMKAWIDRGIQRGPDGLWDSELGQLGDWLDPTAPPHDAADSRTDGTFIADAYLVRVTWIIAQVAKALGNTSDADKYERDWHHFKSLFQKRYVTPAGLVSSDTQTALALVIVFDLLETSEQREAAASRLVRAVRKARFRVSTGFVGTPIIAHALTKVARSQYAYRMLLDKECPSWMYPITMGATTIWERWDSMLPDGSINAGEMTSFNHYALGSIVNWLHESVGGLKPLSPGYKQIQIRPVPGGNVSSAKVAYESPYGRITCAWTLQHETFTLNLVIPANSSAYVVLPDRQRSNAIEDDKDGVWVGSGKHELSCQISSRTDWPLKALHLPFWEPKETDPIA